MNVGWSVTMSAEEELWRVRLEFVQRVSDEVLAQLIEALVSDGVLNRWEGELMWEDPQVTHEKAHCLINTVKREGDEAWGIMIKHLQTRDPLLSSELGLSSAPSSPSDSVSGHHKSRGPSLSSKLDLSSRPSYHFFERHRVETEFPLRVSNRVLTQLIDDLVSDGVLDDKDKKDIMENRAAKAEHVIDTVLHEGDKACRTMIRHLQTIDPLLSSKLGLSSAPSSPSALHSGSFPSVIHFSDDGTSVLEPLEITDTHVVVEVPHLSAFGLVWNIIKDWRKTTIRGQILLFLRKPNVEPKRKYVDMLLLPKDVPLLEVKEKHQISDYISVASNCELIKDETYTVHCEAAMEIKPKKAKFDVEFGPNYHPTFVIVFALDTKKATITVQDQRNTEVWKYDIDLTGDSQVKLDPEAADTEMMEVRKYNKHLMTECSPEGTGEDLQGRMAEDPQIQPPSCFTPEVQTECEQISYRFSFHGPGLFQCSLTGLVFDMTREAKLQYRMIQWDESVLTPTGKTPAGPLFDIKGPEDAVRQLHFPHCETKEALDSGSFVSVIHFSDDGTSVLEPLEITDTHVVVEVPHLSAFGLVWNIIKELWKIRGQILLFLRKPKAEPRREYADMLLLPRNVPLLEVKAQHPNSDSIPVASNCELIKDETYTVHCEAAMKIQPKEAKFDMEFGPNYHATFVIDFALNTEEVTVTVQDQRKTEVWKYDIDLTAVPRIPLVSSSNLQELRQSGDSLEKTPPGPEQRNVPLFFLSRFLPGLVQRSVPLRQSDRNHLLSILEDLNDEHFKDFMWYLKNVPWNNIEPIKEARLSKAKRRDVVDLMLQKYEITGAVQVMETILEMIPRNDLVEKLRAERCSAPNFSRRCSLL